MLGTSNLGDQFVEVLRTYKGLCVQLVDIRLFSPRWFVYVVSHSFIYPCVEILMSKSDFPKPTRNQLSRMVVFLAPLKVSFELRTRKSVLRICFEDGGSNLESCTPTSLLRFPDALAFKAIWQWL